MTTANAIDDLYKRVRAMVPEATSVSVNASRQTSGDGERVFSSYTIMLHCAGATMAHASSLPNEDKAITETMRQVERYRKAKAALPEVCPTCGTAKPVSCCTIPAELAPTEEL